jgi:hypothetical protein
MPAASGRSMTGAVQMSEGQELHKDFAKHQPLQGTTSRRNLFID